MLYKKNFHYKKKRKKMMCHSKIVWLDKDSRTPYSEHYKLLIESGLYKEEPVPPNVNLKDRDCELTQYYLKRLQEEYVGDIVIMDSEKVFISNDNSY